MNKYADVYLPVPTEGFFTYKIPPGITINVGMRVTVPFGSQVLMGGVVNTHSEKKGDYEIKSIQTVIDDLPIFDNRLVLLCDSIADTYVSSPGEVLSLALPGKVNGTSRFSKGFETEKAAVILNQEQLSVYNSILEDSKNIHLIHGVTGSGKTEVYMKLAQSILEKNGSVIFLVPEITLSSQLYRRLSSVFSDTLILYHSALSANQKVDHWKKFFSGEAKIALGTRSAVFLQAPSVKLIIIDEEHDSSYKENKSPRYNTRRVALFRSRLEKLKVVMGSATPSLESYHSALNKKISLHTMQQRYNNASMPSIELVEITDSESSISARLRSAVLDASKKGEQSVLLLNRRGYAPIKICSSCKAKEECPDCNVSLTYHNDGFLRCHYCGYIKHDSIKCTVCGNESMITVGSGTQKIEEEIEKIFPALNIFRLDRDTSKKKNTIVEMIEKINDGSIDVIIGTQMIAKGFDFHNITVVGVLLADIGMNLPDFRANERIFSLLLQVAGRCGRGEKPGRVIIQTLDIKNNIFKHLQAHSYKDFFKDEIQLRQLAGYSPFMRIIRIVFRGKDEAKVSRSSEKAGEYIRSRLETKTFQVLGPAPAPFAKIAANYRYHIIIKHPLTVTVKGLLHSVVKNFKKTGIYVEVDVDPADML
jgi:primosomal protein N' (replication factor Y)